MKQRRLHRRRSIFKRRNPLWGILKWAIPVLAVVALGFFGAKYFSEHPLEPQDPTSPPSSEPGAPDSSAPSAQTPPASAPASMSALKAFYLPADAWLNASADALSDTLTKAAKAGLDSVVLDMKTADGTLLYRSATERANTVGSFDAKALSPEQLKTLFETVRSAGLRPMVRLFAFRDHAAARALADARISYQGQPSWVWYDGDPNNGGRAWLNPYADAAQLYIIDLARELRDWGAAAILLDGVEFPLYTVGADFGTGSNTAMSHAEVLRAFVEHADSLLGADCPVLLACSEKSALGIDTRVYGGNPLTFLADFAAPMLTVGDTENQTASAALQGRLDPLTARIQVMPADEQPVLSPILQIDGASADTLRDALTACEASGIYSFVLYQTKGSYDFSALTF